MALLDGAGHEFAFTALEFAEYVVVLNIAEPLKDDLPCGAGSNAAEAQMVTWPLLRSSSARAFSKAPGDLW
jgi:hypothetical protein